MKPSKYQEAIFDVYDNTHKNIFINAGAGAGKTHTLIGILKRTPKHKKCCFIAFNKSIAEEIKLKVNDESVKVSTIHSLAFSILRKNINANFKLNDKKSYILGKHNLDLSRFKKEKQKNYYLFQLCKLYDFCRMNLVWDAESIEQIATEYGISILNGEVEDTLKLMDIMSKYNNNLRHRDFMIDFTDMIWLCHHKVLDADYDKFDIINIDEVQDLNPLQKEFVSKLAKKNTRFIYCGDERQTIYSFMGSNLKSFKNLQEKDNTVTLPLSVSYRCARSIVAEANKVFEGLESHENAEEGTVRDGSVLEARDGDFIICRNNLPLIETFLRLLENRQKSHILGKDFGVSLINLINKLLNYDSFEIGKEKILSKEFQHLTGKGYKNVNLHPKYAELVEKFKIVELLEKKFNGLENLSKEIEEIFNDNVNSGGIILMTIHKSKGLEADRCFLLGNESLLPSKYALNEEALYQEKCLEYVSITRAKKSIIYCKYNNK